MVIVALTTIAVIVSLPEMPAEWTNIKPGMNREEIQRLLAYPLIDERDAYEQDRAIRNSTYFGYCYTWELIIEYNDKKTAHTIKARTYNDISGIMDQRRIVGG